MAKKAAVGSITKADIYNEKGLRALTASEHRKLGVEPSKRLYTSQKAGVKTLDRNKVVSRRYALEATIFAIEGKKTSLEKKAKENKKLGGGFNERSSFNAIRKRFIAFHGKVSVHMSKSGKRIETYFLPNEKGELVEVKLGEVNTKKNKVFGDLYKAARKEKKNKDGTNNRTIAKARLEAWYQLTGDDKYLKYLQAYH
jgi:hypothetical protein